MSKHDSKRPDERRSVRKAVDIECAFIRSDRDEPIHCRATDLSATGIWLETSEVLSPGELLVVTFRPPHWPSPFSVTVFAEVARITAGRREEERHVSGMGVEFTDLTAAEREALDACLDGLPPPFPRHRKR